MANVLFLYNETQTYTQTVYEYLCAFKKYSTNQYQFAHVSETAECSTQLEAFDAIAIHYTVRLPFNQISPSWISALVQFEKPIFLFIQDEYDYTKRAWYWIKKLGITTVFTCVPEENIEKIYPSSEFDGVTFQNVLTGYVPEELPDTSNLTKPSQRDILIGYRGRPLAPRYGKLGAEKTQIAELVRPFANQFNHRVDIEWTEDKRIYGKDWYRFLSSVRATLGTESGANIFDWDGTLAARMVEGARENPKLSPDELLKDVLGHREEDGLMNQVSPRVFEAISMNTVLVLFPGRYSGVLKAGKHCIELQKDGSNIHEVFETLNNNQKMDAMVETAYRDIINSGKYSYKLFVRLVDETVALPRSDAVPNPLRVGSTMRPIQFRQFLPMPISLREISSIYDIWLLSKIVLDHLFLFLSASVATRLPKPIRKLLKRLLRRVMKI